MRAWLRSYATKHPCHGFRRAWAALRYDERREVNKKIHRRWREEGLQVKVTSSRKRVGVSSIPPIEADAPPMVWAIDFSSSPPSTGRPSSSHRSTSTPAVTVDAYHAARGGASRRGGRGGHGAVRRLSDARPAGHQILALDDPLVEIHAMHEAAAARITLRTVQELEELAKTVLPMSYDVRDWAKLGLCDGLLKVENPDSPTSDDVAGVGAAIDDAVRRARSGPVDSRARDEPGDAVPQDSLGRHSDADVASQVAGSR